MDGAENVNIELYKDEVFKNGHEIIFFYICN